MARLLCSGSRCNSRYLNVHMQAQKEAEALRVAVAMQVRERAVAAQAQARLAAARKQIKALEWSSEVCTSIHTELVYRFLGVHACAASHTGKHVQKGLQSVQCKDEGLQLSKRCYYVALCTAHLLLLLSCRLIAQNGRRAHVQPWLASALATHTVRDLTCAS